MTLHKRLSQRLLHTTARLRREDDGSAAIEFAFIAPVMILMYFGLAEIASAISVDRKISHGTNVAGDLITQDAEMDLAEIEEALSAAIRVMTVNDGGKVTVEMRSYTMDSDDKIRSEGIVQLNKGANTLPAFDPSTLDDKLLSDKSGIVVTRVAYTYTPLKLKFFDSDIMLKETFMLKPRRSDSVTLGDNRRQTITCTGTGYGDVSCTGVDIDS